MAFKGEMADKIERLATERGAKVTRIKAPTGPPATMPEIDPAPDEFRAGALIVEFEVPARPIPWKAATVLKNGGAFKDKSLVAWQAEVRRCAAIAMGGRAPFEGPVELRFLFSLVRKSGSPPDLSNLVKSCEDSLQGSVILNDRLVYSIASRRTFGDRDFAHVKVLVYDPAWC